nr:hypothetical protein [Metallosphaera tengchongensis]
MRSLKSSKKMTEVLSELATFTTHFPTFLAESSKIFPAFLWYDLILLRILFSLHLLSYFLCGHSTGDL